jgi:hypothetical protein
VELGQNPPQIAYWERGEWWLTGNARPRQACSECGIGFTPGMELA